MSDEKIVAVALLTQSNLDTYGAALKRVFPIYETPSFGDLLDAIDQADREHWRSEDRQEALRKLRESRRPALTREHHQHEELHLGAESVFSRALKYCHKTGATSVCSTVARSANPVHFRASGLEDIPE